MRTELKTIPQRATTTYVHGNDDDDDDDDRSSTQSCIGAWGKVRRELITFRIAPPHLTCFGLLFSALFFLFPAETRFFPPVQVLPTTYTVLRMHQ